MFDMEASGFYASAIRYSSQELIQVFKVVSDSPSSPLRRFDKREVSGWISGALETLEPAIDALLELSVEEAQRLEAPAGYAAYLQQWHFTQSQQIQLRRLLCRWEALSELPLKREELAEQSTGRELIQALTERVEALPIRWGEP